MCDCINTCICSHKTEGNIGKVCNCNLLCSNIKCIKWLAENNNM